MTNGLNDIYPEIIQPINLEEKRERNMFLQSLKVFGWTIFIAGSVVIGYKVFVTDRGLSPGEQAQAEMQNAQGKEPYSALISKEKAMLAKVQSACFPLFNIGKDEASCKLWLKQYRDLDDYGYSDSDLFDPNAEGTARAGEEHLRQLDKRVREEERKALETSEAPSPVYPDSGVGKHRKTIIKLTPRLSSSVSTTGSTPPVPTTF